MSSNTATITEKTAPIPGDSALLHRFVRERDQAAFGNLVGRYETVVMGAALRRTGNVEMARDVSQQVFVTLARKAGSLVGHARLAGWLYRTASFQASRLARSERRRQRRESTYANEGGQSANLDDSSAWEPLELALAKMPETKRDLIVMHYFQDRGYREMAGDLGLSEVATRKRVSRALADLAERLERGGVTASATKLLAAAVATQTVLKPAQALAATVLATSPAPLPITSTLIAMTSTNALKIAAVATLIGAIPLGLQYQQTRKSERELALALDRQRPAGELGSNIGASLRSTRDHEALIAQISVRRLQLAKISTDLVSERKRLEKARNSIERIGNEVVISHGKPEDIARQLVPLVKILNRYNNAEEPPSSKESAEMMQQVMGAMELVQSLPKLDSSPAAKARFVATLITETGGFEPDLRDAIEAALLPKFESAKQSGLTFEQQPPADSHELETWNQRYNQATWDQAKTIEPLLPESAVESEIWEMFSKPQEHGGLAELYSSILQMFGTPAEPIPAEPAEESPTGEGKIETPTIGSDK